MRQLRKARNRRVILHAADQTFDGVLVHADFEGVELANVREISDPSKPIVVDGALLVPNGSITFAQVL